MTNSKNAHAAHLQAHGEHLLAHQRASGARIRQCSTGCYSIYNAQGNFIGRTPPPGTLTGLPIEELRMAAARMAYGKELATVCRLADIDFELTGTVAVSTMETIRKLLASIAAA